MSNDSVIGSRQENTASSFENALAFFIEMAQAKINTGTAVKVISVEKAGPEEPVGSLSAIPLVGQRDGYGNTIEPVAIPSLFYFRYQGGKGAFVVDPAPGDIGWASFAKDDISNISNSGQTVPAASFRRFSQADGMYTGGITNKGATTYVFIDPENQTITLKADTKILLDTPLVEFAGRWTQTGEKGESAEMRGGFSNTGGKVSSNGISLEDHQHSNVQPGSGNSGPPK